MDSVLNAMLDLKRHIEEINPSCDVIIYNPIMRFDEASASEIVDHVSRKLLSHGFNVINNQDVSREEVGCKGLHLNEKGNTELPEILLQNYTVCTSLPNHNTDGATKGPRDSYHYLKDSKRGVKLLP